MQENYQKSRELNESIRFRLEHASPSNPAEDQGRMAEASGTSAETDVQRIVTNAKGEKGIKQARNELAKRKERVAERLGGEVHARASAFGEAARIAPRLEDTLATARTRLDRAVSAAEACARESQHFNRTLQSGSSDPHNQSAECTTLQPKGQSAAVQRSEDPTSTAVASSQREHATLHSASREAESLLQSVRDQGNSLRPEERMKAAKRLDELGHAAQAHKELLRRRKQRMRSARRAATPPEHLPALVVEQFARELCGGSQMLHKCFSCPNSRLEELHTWALRESKEVIIALSESAKEIAPHDPIARLRHLGVCVSLLYKGLQPASQESFVPVYQHVAEALCTNAMATARCVSGESRTEAVSKLIRRPSPLTLERANASLQAGVDASA